MSERDTPPWDGGSGGLLEVVDMMCEVTDTMARIIRKQAELIERTKMEEAIREDMRQAREDKEGFELRHEVFLHDAPAPAPEPEEVAE